MKNGRRLFVTDVQQNIIIAAMSIDKRHWICHFTEVDRKQQKITCYIYDSLGGNNVETKYGTFINKWLHYFVIGAYKYEMTQFNNFENSTTQLAENFEFEIHPITFCKYIEKPFLPVTILFNFITIKNFILIIIFLNSI